jgi:putative MATE family efflux protein
VSAVAGTDARLLNEPVPRALLRLALPVLASQALRLGYQWVDAMWVKGLGVQATAAVTTSVFVLWCVYAFNDIFGAGLQAYVSQLIGAGERQRAGVAVAKAITASFVMGLACALAGLFAARPLFALVDPAGGVVEAGATYLRIVLLGAPLVLPALTAEIAFRAAGDTRTPLMLDGVSIALNIVLAPVLIYGLGPAPRLGVAGAAWATVAAQALLAASYAVLALRRHPAFPLARRAPGAPVGIGGLARVGVPAALIGSLFSVVYLAFVRAASPYGEAAVALIGVGNRIEALQFILSLSVGLAGATLLGQALGAGRVDRAEEVLRTAQRWAMLLAAGMTVLLFAFPATVPGPVHARSGDVRARRALPAHPRAHRSSPPASRSPPRDRHGLRAHARDERHLHGGLAAAHSARVHGHALGERRRAGHRRGSSQSPASCAPRCSSAGRRAARGSAGSRASCAATSRRPMRARPAVRDAGAAWGRAVASPLP